MQLATLDWIIIGTYFLVTLAVGVLVSRRSGQNTSQFFLSGRTMPWWLLGFSMVATTFSTDTPNLVTDIVRTSGVAGNWVWWAFLLTGMLTVFVYAKLWRRSGVLTDVEFYEIRYSGPEAAFLRGFRALYLGLFFNTIIMATVTLAAIKIGGIMLGLAPVYTVAIAGTVTVIFAAIGGFRAVVITDAILFCTALAGSLAAAWVALGHPEVGGLANLIQHPNVSGSLNLLPDFSNPDVYIPIFLLPLAVQWWSVWYPGSEPGGGGYVAQRMLAAKDERNAVGAVLFFNAAHYALRPWPWIIVALCSLVVFPTLESIQEAFPNVEKVSHDIAYPAMLTFLPAGLLGFVVASLAAAYMSTISTQLNWGSSYVTNDFWKRFVNPTATEKELVAVGRVSTVLLMVVSALMALAMENALQGFQIMLQVGAGTGLLFILRWFWWRINAWAEIVAMVVSFLVAVAFFLHGRSVTMESEQIPGWIQMISGVAITTFAWIMAVYFGPQTETKRLREFYRLTQPGGPGWRRVIESARADGDRIDEGEGAWDVPLGILAMVLGCAAVYGALFATGNFIYGNTMAAIAMTAASVVSIVLLFVLWGRIQMRSNPASEQ